MASRPRILLSAGMIQGGLSGVGRYVVEIALRAGKSTEIALHVAGLASDRERFPTIPDERWHTIPQQYARGAANLFWHQGALRRLLKQAGVVMYHSPSYRRMIAFCPVAQVATVHDCAPFHLREKYGLARGFFGRVVMPALARRCQHILTVSHFTAQDIERFYRISPSEITVIHNGLDHARYRPLPEDALRAFRERNSLERPYLLYISRLEHPGKNHIRLIEAYERVRAEGALEAPLVLGGAPWHGANVIEARVNASPFKADIRLPGFIDEADLPAWYGAAQALVFPSLIEGFGLPVAEALACGTPVLCSDRGSLPEVGGEAAEYFDPTSIDSIGDALRRFAQQPAGALATKREAGLAQASRFDWDTAAAQTVEAYLRVVKTLPR